MDLARAKYDLRRLRRPGVMAAALATVGAMDALIALLDPPFPALGLLDEPAHVATGVIVLACLARGVRSAGWLVAFWLGAVGIDLDHIPLVFGSQAFSHGTGRPYTHSLLTIAIALAVAASRPRARPLALAFVLGLCTHFSRDLATGGGVALLWPLDDAKVVLPYAAWLAALSALAVVACLRQVRRVRQEATA